MLQLPLHKHVEIKGKITSLTLVQQRAASDVIDIGLLCMRVSRNHKQFTLESDTGHILKGHGNSQTKDQI